MMKKLVLAAVAISFGIGLASTLGHAATVITHAKALQGNVTANDAPGYPVTISAAGSYVFGGNLTVPAGLVGIDVTDHDVTIDLAGYRIHGNGQGKTGIQSSRNSLTVMNGTISLFTQDGIGWVPGGDFLIVEDVRVVGAQRFGVYARGYAQIRNSTFSLNGTAIQCGLFCLVDNNVLAQNLYGISLRSGKVTGNVIQENRYFGITSSGVSTAAASGNVIADNNRNTHNTGQVNNVVLYGSNICKPSPCYAP